MKKLFLILLLIVGFIIPAHGAVRTIRQENYLDKVYLGQNNVITLTLLEYARSVDITDASRIVIMFDTEYVDSNDSPSAFDWTTGPVGKLFLTFGDETITAGEYTATVYKYDSTNTNGLYWDTWDVKIIAVDPNLPSGLLVIYYTDVVDFATVVDYETVMTE